jgi:hypothetical protein
MHRALLPLAASVSSLIDTCRQEFPAELPAAADVNADGMLTRAEAEKLPIVSHRPISGANENQNLTLIVKP